MAHCDINKIGTYIYMYIYKTAFFEKLVLTYILLLRAILIYKNPFHMFHESLAYCLLIFFCLGHCFLSVKIKWLQEAANYNEVQNVSSTFCTHSVEKWKIHSRLKNISWNQFAIWRSNMYWKIWFREIFVKIRESKTS